MNDHHRLRRRVREYMRDLGAYMHHAEPIGQMPRRGLAPRLQPARERFIYEGPVALNFESPYQGFVTLADRDGVDDLAAAVAVMLGAEAEDGWLPDVDVRVRIVVEVLE